MLMLRFVHPPGCNVHIFAREISPRRHGWRQGALAGDELEGKVLYVYVTLLVGVIIIIELFLYIIVYIVSFYFF